jgi:hypothetical protein
MFYTFISLPNVASLSAQIANPAGAIFSDMLPVAYVVVGLAVGLGLLSWAIGKFKGKRGRRR